MLFSHRTFIPVAYWYVSKHLPRLFYRNFNKIQFCSFYNIKIIDRVGHTNTDINEPGLTVTDADLDALLNDLLAEVHAGDIVVLAAVCRGAPQDTYRVWTSACKKAGARCSSMRTALYWQKA